MQEIVHVGVYQGESQEPMLAFVGLGADSALCILGCHTASGYRATDELANRKGRDGQAVC